MHNLHPTEGVCEHVDEAENDSPTLKLKMFAGGLGNKEIDGWYDLDAEIERNRMCLKDQPEQGNNKR